MRTSPPLSRKREVDGAFTGPGDGSLCAQEVVVLTYTKEFEDVAACPVVDTDCHITEPADIWVSRMSSTKWGDLVPHVVRSPEGTDSWFVGDVKVANVDSSAMVRTESGGATRVIGSAAERVTSFDVIHPSAFDASERLKVMDSTGVCVKVARLIDRLKSAVEPEVHEAILWRNAAQLYGLDQDQLVRTAARISQK
jgi:hypothetical protein